ncbi:hypothetical protein [Parathalassolituus penaei]|uniref:Uncharacterized protein n=1 Tax=Parathalassolituus penaei TaxID=2997323 RepID=A0A9X3ISM3_9GAMM|nr:hypothetical protein [Parathalassolituus penaei]MCY0965034.1 hypothetical protein [Parathalassolituus penaei]
MECATDPASIDSLKRQWLRQYERMINKDMASQQTDGMLLRNLTQTMDKVCQELLQTSQKGESGALSADKLLMQLSVFTEGFLADVIQKHRTSCAISNFPR